MKRIVILATFMLLVLSGCTPAPTKAPMPDPTQPQTDTNVSATNTPTPSPTNIKYDMSAEAFNYLETAIDYIEENSVKRNEINWENFREEAYKNARGAQVPSETYLAIGLALSQLNDNHSWFLDPQESGDFIDPQGSSDFDEITNPPQFSFEPKGELIKNKIGYIFMPGFVGEGNVANEFATTIQTLIATIDSSNPCGWIIDLRHNEGGNPWPVLAGIGPILGEGRVGSFVSPDGQTVAYWYYSDGQADQEKSTSTPVQVTGEAYQLQSALPPVAVLFGRRTASGGEFVVVAFIGRPNTQSFGQPTRGATTAPVGHMLSDGAIIVLASFSYADRTGQVYTDRITPDNVIDLYAAADDSDPTLTAATQWLLNEAVCTDPVP